MEQFNLLLIGNGFLMPKLSLREMYLNMWNTDSVLFLRIRKNTEYLFKYFISERIMSLPEKYREYHFVILIQENTG